MRDIKSWPDRYQVKFSSLLCLFLLLFSLHLNSYSEGTSTVNTIEATRSEVSEVRRISKENKAGADKRVEKFSGEYVFDREYKDVLKVFPNRKEYERMVVDQKSGKYEIIYYGVLLEGDHDYLGFFVTKAKDIVIDGNNISFSIGNRNCFPSKHAPHDLEESDKMLEKHLSSGGASEKMLMKGGLAGNTITLHCEGEYGSGDCYSDTMVFTKK